MKVLVDTCALIWFLRNDPKLSEAAAAVIEDPAVEAFVSTVSIWEIAIKARLGKLRAPHGLTTTLEGRLQSEGFRILDVSFRHAAGVYQLPQAHRDPFDRLLIAQCQLESLVAVTDDSRWNDSRYRLKVIWK